MTQFIDGGIYHRTQPTAQTQFRERTEKHKACAGVKEPSFCCAGCGEFKLVRGRKAVTPGTSRDGYLCADCAPAPVAAPPVAPKVVAKAKASPKAEKPAKARKTLLTDEQVLECRSAYEFEGVKPLTLSRRYGVSYNYMKALLDYQTRSKLIPKQPQ